MAQQRKLNYEQIMRLKFEQRTYDEIAKEVGASTTYIGELFATGGRLEVEYAEFKKKMLDALQDEAIDQLRQKVKMAGGVMIKALEHYLRIYREMEQALEKAETDNKRRELLVQMAGVLQKASDQAEKVLDRAGLPVVSKSEIRSGDLPTYDELIKRLANQGVNPETGHRARTEQVLASVGLSN